MQILAFFSFEIAAQETMTLTFESDLQLDSVRIDNLSNGGCYLLNAADSIVFTFEGDDDIANSTRSALSPSIESEPILYPNPCMGIIRVEFTFTHPTRASLVLYDLAGNQLTRMSNYFQQGCHCFTITLNQPGAHILKLVSQSNLYSGLLLNLDGSNADQGIEYTGFKNTRLSNHALSKSVFVFEDTINGIPAEKGDMLRFCGYSGTHMEMFYDFLTNDSNYVFNFPALPAGTYMHLNDTLAFGLDTIYCFATRKGYLFSGDTARSRIFDRDEIILQPVTYGGSSKPEYSWEISQGEVWMLDTSIYLSGVLKPASPKADTSVLTLYDKSNKFTRNYVLIMDPDEFAGEGIALGKIKNDRILDEISGMAASVNNPGFFWVHNDSGDEARIFLINREGGIICTVNLDTDYTDNRDWEDIAVGPGPIEGETYIYVGEIGDLEREYSEKYIFRIIEPEIDTEITNSRLYIPRDKISTITFDYWDGSRDAEILMIDPGTKDLYIITKREDRVQIYVLSYPQNCEEKIYIRRSSVRLPFRMTNGGDISADGKEILVKNLTNVYYWKRKGGESVLEALSRPGEILPYIKEPQGESIAWFRDGSAYLTVSERKNGITPVLYLYKRWW